MAFRLLDTSHREEHILKGDDKKDPTTWVFKHPTGRQMGLVAQMYENDRQYESVFLLIRFCLEDVRGPLGKGFSITKDKKMGCLCVSEAYIDTLPLEVIHKLILIAREIQTPKGKA